MNVREWLNRNSVVAMIVVIVVLILALAYLIRTNVGRDFEEPAEWFYCLDTRQLFGAEPSSMPPIESPWRGEAVSAQVYYCGSCRGEPIIAYLKKLDEQVKQQIEAKRQAVREGRGDQVQSVDTMTLEMTTLVSRPDEINWLLSASPQGRQVTAFRPECPPDKRLKGDCHPKKVDWPKDEQ